MRIIIFIFIISITFLFKLNCKSAEVKEKDKVEEPAKVSETVGTDDEKTIKADLESLKSMEQLLEKPVPSEDPLLHEKILAQIGEIPGEKALSILEKYASHKDEKLREKAILTLLKRKEIAIAENLDSKIYELIKKNEEQYKTLTAAEIQALGQIKESDAITLLNKYLGKDEKNDSLVLQSLGRRLETAENKSEEAFLIEKILLEYLKTNADESLIKLALNTIFHSAVNGKEKVNNIFKSKDYPIETRKTALTVLTENNPKNPADISKDYKKLYYKSAGDIDMKEILIYQMAELEKKSPEEILSEIRAEIKEKERMARIEKEKLEKKKRKFDALKKGSARNALTKLMLNYGISTNTITKMEKSLLYHSENGLSKDNPAKKFVYSALRSMKPKANYFDLRETGLKSLEARGIFSAVMREVVDFHKSEEMRIIALKQIWGITYNEAKLIFLFYKDKSQILKQLSL
ncbi:MAG: hypothetical protein OEZ22_06135 [Spirochaetia bacterium]|nr:hypothetical protein [Spirochaetia bacterium]